MVGCRLWRELSSKRGSEDSLWCYLATVLNMEIRCGLPNLLSGHLSLGQCPPWVEGPLGSLFSLKETLAWGNKRGPGREQNLGGLLCINLLINQRLQWERSRSFIIGLGPYEERSFLGAGSRRRWPLSTGQGWDVWVGCAQGIIGTITHAFRPTPQLKWFSTKI